MCCHILLFVVWYINIHYMVGWMLDTCIFVMFVVEYIYIYVCLDEWDVMELSCCMLGQDALKS